MKLHNILLIVLALLLLLLAGCGDDVAGMPASKCIRRCTDDVTGEEYAIALRGVAWWNSDDDYGSEYTENACHIYIDAFRGKLNEDTGEFEPEALIRQYNKYTTSSGIWEEYTLRFYAASFSTAEFPKEDFYKLLYESTINLDKTGDGIITQYTHTINGCALDKEISLSIICNEDYAAIYCYDETGYEKHARCDDCDNAVCYAADGECVGHDINEDQLHPDLQKLLDEIP